MRKPRFGCVAVAAVTTLVLLTGATPAGATIHATTSPIGKQLAELQAGDGSAGDSFGQAAATSGSVAVIGAPSDASDAGAIYVFSKDGSTWDQVGEVIGLSDEDGYFGDAVAISGDTVVVGAEGQSNSAGAAYVFTDSSGGWSESAALSGSDTVAGDYFGSSVAISGDTIIVGADDADSDVGSAYVFTDIDSKWKQTAELGPAAKNAQEGFGASLAVSGGTALVGAVDLFSGVGRAYVFSESGSKWKQAKVLTDDDDFFAESLSISGDTAVAGGWEAAFVLAKTSSGWKETSRLVGKDPSGGASNYVGSISGTTIVLGASSARTSDEGGAYVFTERSSKWTQLAAVVGSDSASGDDFGNSVALSGSTMLVGADGHDSSKGSAYVFEG